MKTSIKLCGFKNIDDIIFATSLDINYLGMIFVENLPRSIDINTAIKPHPSDLTGKSTYEHTDIKFPNGFIRITCYDMQAHSGTNDALILDFFTEDGDRWLHNEVGKS